MRNFIFFLMLVMMGGQAFAQQPHCFTSEKMKEQLASDLGLAGRRADIEEFTQKWIAENGTEQNREVITIPVVVHVVYKTASQNISDEQIYSQIDVLNEDYRMLNADAASIPSAWNSVKADVGIEFCLAVRDPNGFPTTGITRTETTVTSWNGSDNVKLTSQGGKNAWPAGQYLNIWVCNIGAGLLGYASQPGVTAAMDGLVIGYAYFGRGVPGVSATYNKGRTATHEIGHYFNLDHPWGPNEANANCNQDDAVSDTPKQEGPNFGCQTFPHITCDNGPNGDMFHNFLDYGRDNCLLLFTNGQKERMHAALNGPRASLKTSLGCVPTNVGIEDAPLASQFVMYPNPANDLLTIKSESDILSTADIRIVNVTGIEVMRQIGLNLSNATLSIGHLPVGIYLLEVSTSSEKTISRLHIIR